MTIDNRLNFDKHISAVCNKINNQFNVMLRFSNIISKVTMLKMYNVFILPHFYYCFSVWHFCGTRNSEKLEAVNKCIIRFIFNDYTSNYTTLLNKVEMTSLYNKRIQNFLIRVYKSPFVNDYSTYTRSMFTVRHTTYNLRGTHMLTLIERYSRRIKELYLLIMILSDVCKVSIRLISFHLFLSYFV